MTTDPKQYRLSPAMLAIEALLFATFLFLASCDSSTQPKTATITGNVVLVNDSGNSAFDPVDNSGVTVALYRPAILDTTLVRINSEYPQIGMQVSQVTEFDHRDQTAIQTTVSGADGQFQLKKVTAGTYNVVLVKAGWGVRYVYELTVGDTGAASLGTIELYPVVDLSSGITGDIVFKSHHHYTVNQDSNILGNATLEPNSLISIARGCNLRFYGGISTFDSNDMRALWKIVANEGIFAAEANPVQAADYYAAVVFHDDSTELYNGIIKHAGISVALNGSNSHIKNVLIDRVNSGLTISQSSTVLENVTIANGLSSGVQIMNSIEPVQITNCVFYRHADAINIFTDGGYDISNSYFYGNGYGIRPDRCVGSINHNAFEGNDYDVYQFQVTSDTEISYNNFFHTNRWSIFPRKAAVIHYNNFFHTEGYFIWIRSVGATPYSYVLHDIDATNNYWAVGNVDLYIQDGNDNGDWPNEPCPHYVNYLPKRSVKVPTAGIQ